MKQDITFSKQTPRKGKAICIYAKMGIGKTGSLASVGNDKDILAYNFEDKDMGIVLQQFPDFNPKSLQIIGRETFDEYEDHIAEVHARYQKGEHPYDLIFADGLSFLQTKFKEDFEDSRFDLGLTEVDGKGQVKRTNTIADRFRIEMQDWGGLSSAMSRITSALVNFTVYDIDVIATAHEAENPKWNRELEVAPSFQGKKGYVEIFSGFWQFIGWVQAGIPENNVPQGLCKTLHGFPLPVVRFISKDGAFLARSSSNALNERTEKYGGYCPLNWAGIFKIIEEGVK